MPRKKSILGRLTTEARNKKSAGLDRKSALQIARLINEQDATVAAAVRRVLPQVAKAIDIVAEQLRKGGRLIYVGAGTSGRIAALDASECPPTFNTDPKTVQFVIAGGNAALAGAVEASEDSRELAEADLKGRDISNKDVVVGIAASGRTPYAIAAVEYARKKKARTIAVTCNRNSELARAAEVAIVAEVGPEIVTGSTRMKAGTAQKMVLNMISTGAMARLGYVFDNLMVNVHVKNEKLRERATGIVAQLGGVSSEDAGLALASAGDRVPVALIMLKARADRTTAEKALAAERGHVRKALMNIGRRKQAKNG